MWFTCSAYLIWSEVNLTCRRSQLVLFLWEQVLLPAELQDKWTEELSGQVRGTWKARSCHNSNSYDTTRRLTLNTRMSNALYHWDDTGLTVVVPSPTPLTVTDCTVTGGGHNFTNVNFMLSWGFHCTSICLCPRTKSNVYEFCYETAAKEGVNSRMAYCKPISAKLFLILCYRMHIYVSRC